MKLTNNYDSNRLLADNGKWYNISLTPIEAADNKDANLLCNFTVSCEHEGETIEATGTLIDQPERGTVRADLTGGNADSVLVYHLFDDDNTSLEEALEAAYDVATSGKALEQQIIEEFIAPIMPMIMDKAFSRGEKEGFILGAIMNYSKSIH